MTDDETETETSAMDSLVGRIETDLARGRPRGSVEPPPSASARTRRAAAAGDRSFLAGVATGVTGSAILVQIWFAIVLRDASATLHEWTAYFPSTDPTPITTAIALSRAWQIGTPIGFAIALALGLAFARRRVLPLAIVALLAVCAATFTYVAATAPIKMISGQIEAE